MDLDPNTQSPASPSDYVSEPAPEALEAPVELAPEAASAPAAEAQQPASAAGNRVFDTVGHSILVTSESPTVGVFDSGIGGFTVARSILRRRPDMSLIFYADSVNLPYGGRSREQLTRFAHHTIDFLIEKGIDILGVGCHSSNSAMGQSELKSFNVPVFDLVGSTLDWLASQYGIPERVGVLGTLATVRSQYWERKLKDAFPSMEVIPVAAPDFVPLIEAQVQDTAAIRRSVRHTLRPLLEADVRSIALCCTHYPLLTDFMLEVEPTLQFIDPAECLAERLVKAVAPARPDAPAGKMQFYNSLPGERFYAMGERIFGRSIRELTKMYVVNPRED